MTYLMARASLSIGSVPPLHRGQFSTHIHDWMLFSVELLGEDCTQISLYGVGIHQEGLWEVWILEHCSIDEGHVERLVQLLWSIGLCLAHLFWLNLRGGRLQRRS